MVKKMAKALCCNFTGHDGCVFSPDGGAVCVFYRDDGEKARCDWFERGVLPMDKAIEEQYKMRGDVR